MSIKINCTLLNNKYDQFIDILSDLYKINSSAKIKINNDDFLAYSTEGENENIHALKSYMCKTSTFFEFKTELPNEVDFIVNDLRLFINYLKHLDKNKKILLKLTIEKNNISLWEITDGTLVFKETCAKGYKMRNIGKAQLEKLLDVDNISWKFKIDGESLSKVKRLCKLNGEASKILKLSNVGGKIKFLESGIWSLNVAEAENCDNMNTELIMSKKYFYSINSEYDMAELYVFEHFVLFKENEKNLMICFEKEI